MNKLQKALLDLHIEVVKLKKNLMENYGQCLANPEAWEKELASHYMPIQVGINEVAHQATREQGLSPVIRNGIDSLKGSADEFLLWWDRLDLDFLLHTSEGPMLATNHRTLPPWMLREQIEHVISLIDAPTPPPTATPVLWYSKAKAYEQQILRDVDQLLKTGEGLPHDFTARVIRSHTADNKQAFYPGATVYAGKPVQNLLNNLNRVLRDSGKPCRFTAPNGGEKLILIASEAKAQARKKPSSLRGKGSKKRLKARKKPK